VATPRPKLITNVSDTARNDISLPFAVLSRTDVHVWQVDLDIFGPQVDNLSETLSSDERQRAARFHFDQHRDYWIVARGSLRVILGHYLGMPPDQVHFSVGPRGKLALARAYGGWDLRFNLSHSGTIALFGITRGREIGIDLERVRPVPELDAIAARWFAPGERAVLRSLSPNQRLEAFFSCWTRKEAFIKATGDGLTRALDSFEVSLAPEDPPRLLRSVTDPLEVERWSLQDLQPGPGYLGALAVEGRGWNLSFWNWIAGDAAFVEPGA
jgi:4'-phosphopantetheinyl transferase